MTKVVVILACLGFAARASGHLHRVFDRNLRDPRVLIDPVVSLVRIHVLFRLLSQVRLRIVAVPRHTLKPRLRWHGPVFATHLLPNRRRRSVGPLRNFGGPPENKNAHGVRQQHRYR